jgi:K+-transporting ATPase KdpF subunit
MTFAHIAGAVFAAVVLIYLVFALLNPEKF